MKLWLLEPLEDTERNYHQPGSPWDPWYDKAFGFVVRAESEADARALANEEHGDEGDAWLDPALSKCVELTADGEPGVVLRDFAAA